MALGRPGTVSRQLAHRGHRRAPRGRHPRGDSPTPDQYPAASQQEFDRRRHQARAEEPLLPVRSRVDPASNRRCRSTCASPPWSPETLLRIAGFVMKPWYGIAGSGTPRSGSPVPSASRCAARSRARGLGLDPCGGRFLGWRVRDQTQTQMASLMGMSLSGYRKWEQGRRRISGPAATLLRIIEHDPNAVLRAHGRRHR